jgi:hypothetical protein
LPCAKESPRRQMLDDSSAVWAGGNIKKVTIVWRPGGVASGAAIQQEQVRDVSRRTGSGRSDSAFGNHSSGLKARFSVLFTAWLAVPREGCAPGEPKKAEQIAEGVRGG